MSAKCYIMTVDGEQWFYTRAPISEFLELDGSRRVWFLWDKDHDYLGFYPTKAQMMQRITGICDWEEGDSSYYA